MNSEEQSSTEKFTGTMPVQDKLRFPEKELEAYLNDTISDFEGAETFGSRCGCSHSAIS